MSRWWLPELRGKLKSAWHYCKEGVFPVAFTEKIIKNKFWTFYKKHNIYNSTSNQLHTFWRLSAWCCISVCVLFSWWLVMSLSLVFITLSIHGQICYHLHSILQSVYVWAHMLICVLRKYSQWFGLSGREADTQRGHNSIEKKVLHITAIYRILKSQQRH